MTTLLKIVIASVTFLPLVSCKSDDKPSSKVEEALHRESTKLYVFKASNSALRNAIREEGSFDGVKFEGDVADYSIVLVAEAKTKEEATALLNSVKKFALEWGAKPENQNHFHPDDGLDEDGNRKYKKIIENAVRLEHNKN